MPPYNTINLHPPDYLPSALTSDSYDVICIGSGWAGHITAVRIAQAGMTAVIVEEELFGGDCPFWACVPSKALLRPEEALDEAKRVGGAREKTDASGGPDVEAVFRRRDGWTKGWQDGAVIQNAFEGTGVQLVRGHGTIVGVKKLTVENSNGESRTLEANYAIVICTGSEPIIPDIPGLAEAKPWTPREAMSASEVPQELVVLGAGGVGCETVNIYTSVGGKVSLISSTAEILPRMDPEAGAIVRQSFTKQGVDVHLSTKVTSVRRETDKTLTVELNGKDKIKATEIFAAAGRRARTEGMGLEKFSVEVHKGRIVVDDSLCIAAVPGRWLYAAGDVNARAPLSHMAKYHGRVVANAILATKNKAQIEGSVYTATADHYAIPQVVFTRPSVASVGLTKRAAQAAGKKVKEIVAPVKTMGANLRTDGYEDGWAQWIVDEESGKLVGATFVGEEVADLLHASTVAIVGGLTLDRLAHAVPSFPTMSEVYLNLIEAAGY